MNKCFPDREREKKTHTESPYTGGNCQISLSVPIGMDADAKQFVDVF